MLTIFMFESQLMQHPAPGTLSFIVPAPGHFLLCKSPGAGHTFQCKSPGLLGGGMVIGQSDTPISMSSILWRKDYINLCAPIFILKYNSKVYEKQINSQASEFIEANTILPLCSLPDFL